MQFPYGISDFGTIVHDKYFYADRTGIIPYIEQTARQLIFLRPRRFGKSLLLSMLEHYYDLSKADRFEGTFGPLAIGKTPTDLHSQYFVLKWDFSAISSQGDLDALKQALYNHINGRIAAFADYYSDYLTCAVTIDKEDALASWQSLLTAVNRTGHKVYLLIDEYDNFANEILMGGHPQGQERYEALLEGEGILKALFKAVKAAAAGWGLDRVFITGVSPIVLSDMTSGYNVAMNVTLAKPLHELCGFTQEEINALVHKSIAQEWLPADQLESAITFLKAYYDGYRFSRSSDQRLYNPTMILYFFHTLQQEKVWPKDMLDSNLAMDRGKLSYIASLPQGEQIIEAAIEHRPISLRNLSQSFGIQDILYGKKDEAFMISLLYFFGVLTIEGEDDFGEICFCVPNQAIFRLYVEELKKVVLPQWKDSEYKQILRDFYAKGQLEPVCKNIEKEILPVFDNRDYALVNELTLKTAFLLFLFNDDLYSMDSEASVGRGYADLAMIVRPDARRYSILDCVFEFKYVSLKVLGLEGKQLEEMSEEECLQLPAVQQALKQGREQLGRYAQSLLQRSGDELRLGCFVVVALGLQRLLFEAC